MRRSQGKRTTRSWQAEILAVVLHGTPDQAKPKALLGTVLGTAEVAVQKIQLNQRLLADKLVELSGIEPLTSSLRTTRSPN
jgi:hypothetical protein